MVDESVVVNTPCALVVPEVAPKTSPAPLLDSVTSVPPTALPWASSTVTVSVVVDTPSAVTDPGLATKVEVAAETGNATDVMNVGARFGDAPAAESSEVPADVPSVTHRL